MKKSFYSSLLLVLLALANYQSQVYVPVATTGYTLDGVAENTTAIATTGAAMDASNFNLYSQFYGTLYNPVGAGLPNNGTLASGTRTYQLQSYTGPNVLFIPANQKDSLTFVTPQAFPNISLLSFATQGNATMSITVRFTDNSTQVFSPISLADWFAANPSVYSGFDRVLRTTGVPAYVASAGNPRMFGTDLAILCANQGKQIKRVIIQNNSGAFVCVMAVAGNPPGYSVNGNTSVCSAGTATLNATGFTTYTWQAGSGFGGSNASTINVNPTATTEYTLIGTDANGCPGYTTITVNVNSALPVLSLTGSTQSVCLGAAATLTASGASTYTWTGGVTNGVPFFPNATNTYTVSGENGCGITTTVSTINVGPIPVSIASTNTSVCTNKTATLSVTATANSFTVLPLNTVTASSVIIVSPSVTTIYTITASNGTCTGNNTFSLQADPIPTLQLSVGNTTLCPGESTNLIITGGNNYSWTPGGQTTATITVSPATTTLYTVMGDNAFGCTSSTSQVIVVATQPTLLVQSNQSTVCAGGSATLTATGAGSFAWNGGPTTNTYVVTPAGLTTYSVTGTNLGSGCSNIGIVTVDVFTPSVAISGNSTICSGGSSNLTAIGAGNYVWNPGGFTFPNLAVSPIINTTYTLSAIDAIGTLTCPVSATFEVIVHPNPTLTAAMSPSPVCAKNTATVSASGAATYTWTNPSTTLSSQSFTFISSKSEILVYTLTGRNAVGCESTLSFPISISSCAGLDEYLNQEEDVLIYPNPNNGSFTLASKMEQTLVLINQLGQIVYEIQLKPNEEHKINLPKVANGVYYLKSERNTYKLLISEK